jgi:hypothetical protein
MKWVKQGVIFAPDHDFDWMASHASIPVADPVSDEVLRIYFGARDRHGRSHLAYLEVEAGDPRRVLGLHDRPVLPLGEPGTFDDSGIMPSWLVNHEGRKYLYYIGWNPQLTVSYRLAIGLAVSEDGGQSFRKYSTGPILDRALDEPYFNTAPCVLREGDTWRMWYVSCTGWEVVDGRTEPRYHVRYAESLDGILWRRTGLVCIDYDAGTQAIGRPCVFAENGAYRMLYSYRGIDSYRTDPARSYRLGYAESTDGLAWARSDNEVGIERSESGWDSEMIEYCYHLRHRGRTYLFYNGNEFGRTGIGYAMLES